MRILTGRSELRTPLEGLPPACRNCRNCHCNCPGCRTTSLTWGSWHRIRREDLASTCRETPCNHLSDSEKQQNGPTAKVELMITYQQNINKISTKYQQIGTSMWFKADWPRHSRHRPIHPARRSMRRSRRFWGPGRCPGLPQHPMENSPDWGPKDRYLVSPWSGFYIGNFEFTVACPTTVTTGRKFLSSAPR